MVKLIIIITCICLCSIVFSFSIELILILFKGVTMYRISTGLKLNLLHLLASIRLFYIIVIVNKFFFLV